MHLGMSGSFRIEADGTRPIAGALLSPARQARAPTTMSSSTCPRGARVVFNDPRRFGLMDLMPRGGFETRQPFRAASGIEPLGNELVGGDARRGCFAGRARAAEGSAHGPAADRRARQHLCLRGAVAGAALADARRPARSRRRAASRPRRRGGSPRRSATVLPRRDRGRRLVAPRPRPQPTASSATSSTASRSTTARASPARAATAASSGASCSPAARPSIARSASAEVAGTRDAWPIENHPRRDARRGRR